MYTRPTAIFQWLVINLHSSVHFLNNSAGQFSISGRIFHSIRAAWPCHALLSLSHYYLPNYLSCKSQFSRLSLLSLQLCNTETFYVLMPLFCVHSYCLCATLLYATVKQVPAFISGDLDYYRAMDVF